MDGGIVLDRIDDECLYLSRSSVKRLVGPLAGPEESVETVHTEPAAAVTSELLCLVSQQLAGPSPALRVRHRTGERRACSRSHGQDSDDLCAPGHAPGTARPGNGPSGSLQLGEPVIAAPR